MRLIKPDLSTWSQKMVLCKYPGKIITYFIVSGEINVYQMKTSKFHREFMFVCLCWAFTAQSTQWGHVDRGQFT